MAISTGAAIIGGSVVSGLAGMSAADAQADAAKAGLTEQRRQFDLARADLAPYREVGTAALEQLAAALGIEGYRTPEELAYTKFQSDDKAYQKAKKQSTATVKKYDFLNNSPMVASPGQKSAQQTVADWEAESARLKAAAEASVANYDPSAAARARLETDPGYGFRLSQGEQALERSQAATTGVLGGRAVKEGLRYNQDYASNEYGNYINRLAGAAGVGQSSSTTSAGLSAAAGPANAAQLNAIGSSKAGAYGAANQAVQGGLSNYLTMSMYDKLLQGNNAASTGGNMATMVG
jgi:hypothetical protein